MRDAPERQGANAGGPPIGPLAAEAPVGVRLVPRIGWLDRLHGEVYTRLFYAYTALAIGTRPLVQTIVGGLTIVARRIAMLRGRQPATSGDLMADSVHGKVVTTQDARRFLHLDEDIELPNPERVIPFPHAREIVIRHPDHIAVMECPCRVSRGTEACLPLDVCLIIGEPFATRFVRAHPTRARQIGRDEAIEILQAERERGHVHHAFFKDAMGDGFYAICNCCACCCGPMQYFQTGTPMLASSGYVCEIDGTRCVGCGVCATFCQFSAITVHDGNARVTRAACMGCGVCEWKCAHGAARLVRAVDRGQPLDLRLALAPMRDRAESHTRPQP